MVSPPLIAAEWLRKEHGVPAQLWTTTKTFARRVDPRPEFALQVALAIEPDQPEDGIAVGIDAVDKDLDRGDHAFRAEGSYSRRDPRAVPRRVGDRHVLRLLDDRSTRVEDLGPVLRDTAGIAGEVVGQYRLQKNTSH